MIGINKKNLLGLVNGLNLLLNAVLDWASFWLIIESLLRRLVFVNLRDFSWIFALNSF